MLGIDVTCNHYAENEDIERSTFFDNQGALWIVAVSGAACWNGWDDLVGFFMGSSIFIKILILGIGTAIMGGKGIQVSGALLG